MRQVVGSCCISVAEATEEAFGGPREKKEESKSVVH